MSCAQCQDQLVAYVEGLITDQQKTDIDNHLTECAACQQELQSISALQDRLVDRGKALDTSQLETDVLSAIVREQKQRLDTPHRASRALSLRSHIMKSPLARISIAAVVVLGCVIAFQTVMKPSVALADVLTQIEKVSAYMYQTSVSWIGEPPVYNPFDSNEPTTVLVSQEHGYAEKNTTTMRDPNSQEKSLTEHYLLPDQHKLVTINHKDKQYIEVAFNEDMVKRQRGQRDARAIVRQILKCEHESLGNDTIDGIDCEGFRTTDPTYAGGLFGEVRVELWVDRQTYLPVRLEIEMQVDENSRLHTISDQFQWDVQVGAQEFEPVIPKGYTTPTQGPIQMPAMNEETLIKGLRLCVDMNSPSYPDTLTMQSMTQIMQQYQQAMQPFQESNDKEGAQEFMAKLTGIELSQEKPKQEQIMQVVTHLMRTAQGPSLFYSTLVQDQKDPAYHGDIVTPKDAEQVLVRWQVSDAKYRVIFGDLRAETVSAEVLAELEKVLPK